MSGAITAWSLADLEGLPLAQGPGDPPAVVDGAFLERLFALGRGVGAGGAPGPAGAAP
jgi:hypothetical protein